MITAERLKELLVYHPLEGIFTWKCQHGQKSHPGTRAGSFNASTGYNTVMLDGKNYLCGRLAWFYVHGKWPKPKIDHQDRNRANDKFDNLREATNTLSGANRGKDPRTKYRGVYRHRNKWQAKIKWHRIVTCLGTHEHEEDAARAYDAAAVVAFGEFAQLNFPEERPT